MADKFITVAITMPSFYEEEANQITYLLENGVDWLHVRKPHGSHSEIENLITHIPSRLHTRLRLHDAHHLIEKYPLGGIHLNRRNPHIIPGTAYTAGCHSVEELYGWPDADYLFLSPVFDSISKPGYKSAFDLNALAPHIAHRAVVALGGVRPLHIPGLKEAGFSGAAMLGEVWKNPKLFIENLKYYKQHIV